MALLLRDSPNGDQTPAEFLEALLACLLLFGNAFAAKTVTGGQVRALTILWPELVIIRRQDDGSLTYAYADPHAPIEYREDEVWHLKGFGFGGLLGLSPIAYARQTLATAMAADEVAGRTFANGMNPSGIITYEGKDLLTPARRAQAKTALIDEQSMRRALIPPAERATLYVEFVREGLLRADTAGRAEAYSKLMQTGAITPNMIADREQACAAADPLVRSGNPPHRHPSRPAPNPARPHRRLVALATSPPSLGPSGPP